MKFSSQPANNLVYSSVEDHADTKKRRTQDHAQEIGRFNLVLRMPRAVQRPNADPSYEDGRQHDLQDCEFPEAELVYNDGVVCHAAPVQQHAKKHAERNREPTGGVTGKRKGHESLRLGFALAAREQKQRGDHAKGKQRQEEHPTAQRQLQ